MKSAFQTSLVFAAFLIAGCILESDNDLPPTNLHDDERIVGRFYFEEEKGSRYEIQIEKASETKGHYRFLEGTPKVAEPFRLFKIGDAEFISTKSTDRKGGETGYCISRITVSDTKLVVEMLDDEWLIANPQALPGTEITERGILRWKVARLRASPEQLEQFLRAHADSKTVFDVEYPIVLNRVEK